eukprot:gb/GECG01008196.1/.p1 GENE.gb/GECG01008196.1/~~gb/GECG01008196.1/.p1  ORF type:complete len:404 (+),score=28.14 gb/GECG01008196.1/:1-1212(+)
MEASFPAGAALYVSECNPILQRDLHILADLKKNEQTYQQVFFLPVGDDYLSKSQSKHRYPGSATAFQRYLLSHLAVDSTFSAGSNVFVSGMENYNKPTINNAIQTIASLGVENVTICCSAKIQRFLIGGGFSAGTPWWGDWINRLPSKFWDEEKPTGGRFETSTKSVSWQVMSDPLTEEQNDNLFTFFQRNDHIKLHKYVPKVVVQCVRRYGWYGFNLRDATSKIAGSKCWTTFQALREATENSTRDDVAVSSSTSRIAVLGGSFNPITCGHIAATRCLLDNDRINAIQLLPCGPRPDKRSLQSSTLERFLFCFEAIEEFFPYNVPVFACPLEVWENVAVASAELIPTLRKTFGTHFSLVIGSDLIESLPKWRNAENLTTQCSFLLLHREGVKNTIEGCEKKT